MDKFIDILRHIRDVIWVDIQARYTEINQFAIDSQNIMSDASSSALSAVNAANAAQAAKVSSDQNVVISADNTAAAQSYANQSKGYRDEAEQFAQETQDIAGLIGQGSFLKGNNLSDVLDVEEVRNNLGVDSSAEVDLKLSAPDINVIANTTIQAGHHKSYAGRIITSGRVVVRGILSSVSSKPNEVQNDFSVQAGEYRDFAMMNPKGRWLFCDGRAISRVQYPELFAAIGTVYGLGDGASTFNIPDTRGLFKRSAGLGGGVDEHKYRSIGSKQGDSVKSHTHTTPLDDGGFFAYGGGGGMAGTNRPLEADGTSGAYGAAETRPVNIAVYTCIRY